MRAAPVLAATLIATVPLPVPLEPDVTLMNGEFMVQHAARFAARLRALRPDDLRGQVDQAWRIALGRPAAGEETARAVAAIEGGQQTLERFCLVMLNMNEFLYAD